MLVMFFCGCTPTSIEKVYGTYVATYPFGTDTITLNRNGSFVQQVIVNNDPTPANIKGHWIFNSDNGYVTFDAYLAIDDGFGRLNSKWRTPDGNADLPVDRAMFRTIMSSGAQHPYVKQ